MRRHPLSTPQAANRGLVLPIALIMLVIISFAGLLAARNSATFEQFSNNMRTNQVARVSAEDALRHCERIAIDSTDGGATFPADVTKIVATEISTDDISAISSGMWNTRSNWVTGAPNLISFQAQFGSDVASSAQLRNNATCVIQRMVNDRFLITSRGLSSDAMIAADGTLSAGSEVWLQSILTPSVPTLHPLAE
jgi:type IV pilus assembly protein PilX